MKRLKFITTVLLFTFVFFSCDEDKWLEEVAYDFYSTDNAYVTYEQFNSAVANLYYSTDKYTVRGGAAGMYIFHYTSDIAYDAITATHALNSYSAKIVPNNSNVRIFWQRFYDVIYDANVILSRIDGEDTEFESEEQRTILKAEARFFRGYMYRTLGIQFGGVPLITEEISEPKRDFVRSTREETLQQAIDDIEFAAANLPSVNELDTERLTKAAANHLLAELYITKGDYATAIEKASAVIDGGNYALMTERFGSRVDEPGDVIWDLYRTNNHNRRTYGNTESIWVAQSDYQVEGGEIWTYISGYLVPGYYGIKDNNGENLFLGPMDIYAGRGIGWFAPSDYILTDIWENDSTDIRNSEYNIIRDIAATNPESEYFGQGILESNAFNSDDLSTTNKYNRQFSAIITKVTTIGNYPDEDYDDIENGVVNRNTMASCNDIYHMRLAETYLLRAEAYMKDGNTIKAAEDINVVRTRAHAAPVTAGDIDLDFLLDERARELNFEEFRTLTLARNNLLPERLREYNPMYNGRYGTNEVFDYQNLYPIPQKEIENNTEAVLEQNPGY